jgi:hypothetical protein
MSWGFEEGKVYNRRADIHAKFAGQQQGGIITPSQHALVVIITGEEGLAHGYHDRTRDDGVFEYFGEGQIGDMVLQRGNLAIASHVADGKVSFSFVSQKTACASLAKWFTRSITSSVNLITRINSAMPSCLSYAR